MLSIIEEKTKEGENKKDKEILVGSTIEGKIYREYR